MRINLVDDELIRYIADTINWIPTFNPDRKEHITGLCYWGGNRIIDNNGADKLSDVLKGSISIFSTANDNVELKGALITDEDEVYGEYELIRYKKYELIEILSMLLSLVERVQKEEKILLHMGV